MSKAISSFSEFAFDPNRHDALEVSSSRTQQIGSVDSSVVSQLAMVLDDTSSICGRHPKNHLW
jgi:hypothetical protein